MGRKLRVRYPQANYHVMNRGERREPIFQDDWDQQRFLHTRAEVCAKTDWQMHAWCFWVEEGSLDRARSAFEAEVRPGEDQAGHAPASGNDDDAQMDRGTAPNESLDTLEQTPL